MQYASKRNRKERAIGGIMVKVRLRIEKERDRGGNGEERMVEIKIRFP